MQRFDKIIATLSPSWAASRARARRETLQHEMVTTQLRKYEAASTGGRRNGHVIATGSDANSEVGSSARITRNFARQLVRDNPMAAAAVQIIAANVVGRGIRPEIMGRTKTIEKRAEADWAAWAGSTKIDYDGDLTLAGLESLVMRTVVESGSCLVKRVRTRSAARLTVPFRLQVLEPDYLDTGMDGTLTNGKEIIQGKQYDASGELEGYWLYKKHPGAQIGVLDFKSVFVPASDVIHVYRKDRAGQVNGITWLAPVMNIMRDLMETRDAYQLRQKISACFAAFVYDSDGTGGGVGSADSALVSHVEPGRISTLPPGKDIRFAAPPGVDGMAEFDRLQQISIATGLGIPYEAFGDLSNVNFLSGRMGWLKFYKNVDSWREGFLIPKFCGGVFGWFAEAMELRLAVEGVRDPQLSASWTAPDRDLLDPKKELEAVRDEHRLGALPWGDLVRMRGRDPEKVLEQYQRWNKALDDAGLVFDGDPRHVSRAGNTNAKNPADNDEESESDVDE